MSPWVSSEWFFDPPEPATGYSGGYSHEHCTRDDRPAGVSELVVAEPKPAVLTLVCRACGGTLEIPEAD